MNPALFKLMQENRKQQYNPLITRGYVYAVLTDKEMENFVDTLIRENTKDFPGLEYLGLSKVTPAEEVRQSFIREKSRTKLMYDRSDVYMVKTEFRYQGVLLKPNYLKLLFVGPGSHLILDNSNFFIHPIMVANGFSVSKGKIFAWFARSNLQMESNTHLFMRNNESYMERFVHTSLHQQTNQTKSLKQVQDDRKITSRTQPIALYLLLERGLKDACKTYFDADVITSNEDLDILEEKYTRDKFYICQTAGKRPKSIQKTRFTISSFKIIVPIEQWNAGISGFIAGLFWVIDHFPERMVAEYMDDNRFWKPIAGHLIFNTNDHEGKLSDDIDRHLKNSVDLLMDAITRSEFKAGNLHFDTIYQLLAYVINNAVHILASEEPGSLYDKRLSVTRYVLRKLTSMINKLGYSLTKLKERGDFIPKNKVEDILKLHINQSSLNELKRINGEVGNIQTSSDNMFFKVTSKIIPQEKNDKRHNKKGDRGALRDPNRFFHISILSHGRLCSQPKYSPDSRGEINPYLKVGLDGRLIHDPIYNEKLQRWANEMSGRKLGDYGEDEVDLTSVEQENED